MLSSRRRTFFIGDVHGCLSELKELLQWLSARRQFDRELGAETAREAAGARFIFLGDLIGKGPESAAVVNFLAELHHRAERQCFSAQEEKLKEQPVRYVFLMGNHEKAFLNGPSKPEWTEMQTQLSPLGRQLLFERLVPYWEEEHFLAVHAGLDPALPVAENTLKTLLTVRELHCRPWHAAYRAAKPIIYGHWAKQGLCIKANSFGLDSGCVYGGWLTALELETKRLFQVRAKKSYCPIKRNAKVAAIPPAAH